MKFKSQSLLLLKLDFLAFFSILYRVISVVLFLALFICMNVSLIYGISMKINTDFNIFSTILHFIFYFIVIFHIFYGRLKFLLTVDKILIFVSNNIVNIIRLYSIFFLIIIILSFIFWEVNFLNISSIFENIFEILVLFSIVKITKTNAMLFLFSWIATSNFINNLLFFLCYILFFYIKYTAFLFFFKKKFLFFYEKIFMLYYSWLPLKKMLFEKYMEVYKNKNFYTVFMWEDSKFNKILLKRSLFAKWFQNKNMDIADHNFKDPLYIVVLDSYIYFLQRCCSVYFLYIEQELLKKI